MGKSLVASRALRGSLLSHGDFLACWELGQGHAEGVYEVVVGGVEDVAELAADMGGHY